MPPRTSGVRTDRRLMTPIRGPLARVDRSREELAKAFLVRLIERASLDEIRDLPTERIARELPELISDILASVAGTSRTGPTRTSWPTSRWSAPRRSPRCAAAATRSVAEVARDVASLQAVLVRALREELAENDPEQFADAVEHLVDATGAIQAAVTEELVRSRSRELESQANTDALTGPRQPPPPPARDRPPARPPQALRAPVRAAPDGRGRPQADQRLARPPGRRPRADAGGDVGAAARSARWTSPPGSAATSSACSPPSRTRPTP